VEPKLRPIDTGGISRHGYCRASEAIPQLQEKKRVHEPPIALDQEILTLKDVCELLQVHQSTVYKLVKEGKIPAFRIGSDWRFRTDLMMRWMDEHSLPSRGFDIDPQTPWT